MSINTHTGMTGTVTTVVTWPTRSAEIERVQEVVASGHSVLVVGFAGDGTNLVAQALADSLSSGSASGRFPGTALPDAAGSASASASPSASSAGRTAGTRRQHGGTAAERGTQARDVGQVDTGECRLFNASAHSDLDELEAFLAVPSPGVIHSADQLPDEAVSLIDAAINTGEAPMVYVLDGDALRTSQYNAESVVGLLASAWSRDGLDRVDLKPLSREEILALISDAVEPGVLDDLQLHTLVSLAGGQPLVAMDLVSEAMAAPARVPHRFPRPGVDTSAFGSRALLRVSRRYTHLEPELALAARRLARLSPLHLSTASRLFGEANVSQLLLLRLAFEVQDTGEPLVAVSPLHGAGLANRCLGKLDDEEGYRNNLCALWRAGYPLSEAAMFEIGHRAVENGQEVDAETAGLLVEAARAANRLGDPLEAGILRRAAESSAALTPELTGKILMERIRTEMLLGRHDQARATAQEALTQAGEQLDFELLYYVSVAAAWAHTPPQWWIDIMDSPAAAAIPGAREVLIAFVGTGSDTATIAEQLKSVADEDGVAPEIRLLALAYVTATQLNLGNAAELERLVQLGIRVSWTFALTAHGDSSDLGRSCATFFLLSATTTSMLGGVASSETHDIIRETLAIATGVTRRAGWHVAMCTAWMTGLARVLQGEQAAATLDYNRSARELRPSHFPLMWTVNVTVGTFLQRLAGIRPTLAHHVRQPAYSTSLDTKKLTLGSLLTDTTVSDAELLASSLPAWAPRLLIEARVTDGIMSPEDGLAALAKLEPTTLPAGLAQEAHVRAIAAQDPDAFLSAGRALADIGAIAMARHAFSHARALYLGRRSAGKAAEAGEALASLGRSVAEAPANESEAVAQSASAVRLTDRELQVCRLIAEGLTNVQISEKLTLSVRTVESHVLQSRAKLGAPRRRDIPALLLKYDQVHARG